MNTIQQEEIARRMRLAQALQQQAAEPIQSAPGGAVSWTQGLAKMLQAVGAARQEKRAMEDYKTMQAQRQDALAKALTLPADQQPAALMGIEGFEDTGAKLMIESSRNRQLAEMLAGAAKGNPDVDPNQLAARTTLGGADAAFSYLDRVTPTPAQERDYRFKTEERDYARGRDAQQDAIRKAELADRGITVSGGAMPVQGPGSMTPAQIIAIVDRTRPDATPEERALLLATIQEESAFNPDATSEAGARGLGQFIPETGGRYGLTDQNFTDPEAQIPAIIDYQRDLAKEAGGFSPYAIATGYHAGEGGLQTGEGVGPRTTGYAARVNQAYKERLQEIEAMRNAGVISPSQARDATASAKKDAAAQVKDEMAQEISPVEQERLNMERERLDLAKREAEAKQKNPMGLTPQQIGNVRQKQKLIENVLIPQLETLKQTILGKGEGGALDPTKLNPDLAPATGFFQGLIPKQFTELGGTLEADVDNLRSTITSLKRVPGVGAQSNYEAMLDQSPLPDRRDDPKTLLRKIQNLENTILGYKNLNDELVSSVGANSTQGYTIELAE